jgi:predicted aspartyl protease
MKVKTAGALLTVMGVALKSLAASPASAPSSPISVSVPIDLVSNLPFLPVRVNGSEALSGILDSGAGISVVDPHVANTLGLLSAGSVQAGGFGQGTDQTLHLVDHANLTLGSPGKELSLSNQAIAVLPIDYIGSQTGRRTDALFGSNIFQGFRVTVDYEHRKAVFASFDAPFQGTGYAIPIDVTDNVPVVDVTLSGENGVETKTKVVVDIGTTGALIISKQFMDAHPELSAGHSWVDAPSASAVGGTVQFKLIRLTGLKLGPFRLSAPIAVVPGKASGVLATPGLAGLLGGEVLNRFTVTWDYQSGRMWLVPNGRLHRPFEADASGLHLVARGARLEEIFVDEVLSGSAADQAGLRVGDRIVEADGRALRLWELGKILMRSGSVVSLTIARDGAERRVLLHLKALL